MRLHAARLSLVPVLVLALTAAGCAGQEEQTTGSRPVQVLPESPAPSPAPVAATAPDVPVRPAALTAQPADATTGGRPVLVRVPSQEIEVPVDPVGVQPDGQMEIPPLAERAGWYRFGSVPADTVGSTVIAAHVDSVASAGLGPFSRLGDVVPGAEVEVTLEDGAVHRYTVTSVATVPKADATWSEVFTRDGPRRLVLITCGGTFQREAGRYSDNVILTAEHVGG